MARQESDREDLMAEATALTERGEFRIAGSPTTVVAGYRRSGALSIYCGPDPCYHFDEQLRLRRAFVDGDLYRTQGTTLARLNRIRGPHQTELLRHDLSEAELAAFCERIHEQLRSLQGSLSDAECLQVVPPDVDLRSRLMSSLQQLTAESIRLAPQLRGKR